MAISNASRPNDRNEVNSPLAPHWNRIVAAIAFALAASADTGIAKRAVPKPVKPVTAMGTIYSAPADKMGFVVASDAASGRELWRQRIYSIRLEPALERDVQDVFITSLRRRGRVLIITNERGAVFLLDLRTRKVTRESDRNSS